MNAFDKLLQPQAAKPAISADSGGATSPQFSPTTERALKAITPAMSKGRAALETPRGSLRAVKSRRDDITDEFGNIDLDVLTGRKQQARADRLNEQRATLRKQYEDAQMAGAYATDPLIAEQAKRSEASLLEQLHGVDDQQGVKKAYSPIEQVQRFGTRLKDIGVAAATGSGSGYVGAAAGTANMLNDVRDEALAGSSDYERAMANSMYAGYMTDDLSAGNAQAAFEQNPSAITNENIVAGDKQIAARYTKVADDLARQSAEATAQAKDGLGGVGSLAVDIAVNALQMAGDAAGQAVGMGMIPFFVRAAGGSMNEARADGANSKQAFSYGIAKGAVEVLTEKMFGGIAGFALGKPDENALVEALTQRLAQTDAGRTVVRAVLTAAGEGVEEVVSDLADPFAKAIYDHWGAARKFITSEGQVDFLANAGYDFLVGSLSAAAGVGTNIATGRDAQANNRLRIEDASRAYAPPRKPTPAPGLKNSATTTTEIIPASEVEAPIPPVGASPTTEDSSPVELGTQNAAQAVSPAGGIDAAPTTKNADTAAPVEFDRVRKPMSMEDYANNDSPVWNMLDYEDTETQQAETETTHDRMVSEGKVVEIPDSTQQQVSEYFPDTRGMKKAERLPIIKRKMNELKTSLRSFLNGLKGGSFEFEVNGNILDARLYETGVKEVLEKLKSDKASMLYHSDDIFKNAEYLYSTPDYDGNPDIYRWNYFYTPVKIGDTITGVRIAVRDMANVPGSQIYNWGIKKSPSLGDVKSGQNRVPHPASSVGDNSASLAGAGRGQNRFSSGGSSDAAEGVPSTASIDAPAQNVKQENTAPHIDNRSFADVADRKMPSFQFEHPEVHEHFVQAAQQLADEVARAEDVAKIHNQQARQSRVNGSSHEYSAPLSRLFDAGLTKPEIMKALDAIIHDEGQENYAAAKRVEIVLSDMMTHGWRSMSGETIAPNAAYVQAKDSITGGKHSQSWESYLEENELRLLEGDTEEDLRAEWEAMQNGEEETVLNEATGLPGSEEAETPEPSYTFREGESRREKPTGETLTETQRERGFSQNVRTDTAMEADLRADMEANPELYTQLSNKDTLAKAKILFKAGFDDARASLNQAIADAQAGKKLAPEMVPLSRMVANELSRRGDVAEAHRITADIAAELTAAGQLGQAAAILRNADPMTAQKTIQNQLDSINRDLEKKFGSRVKWKAELTEAEQDRIAHTDFSEDGAFEAVWDGIAKRLGAEMPSTLWEKITEIRRVGMLLRPRTQIKNVMANMPSIPMRKTAELMSGAIQDIAVKAGWMRKEQQTRSVLVKKEHRALAGEVFEAYKEAINGQSNKWDMNSTLRNYRQYFKKGFLEKCLVSVGVDMETSVMDAARNLTYSLLEKGDAPFVRLAFMDSMAEYCAARNITDMENVPQSAIDFATANAMEATFKSANVLAEAINKLKNSGTLSGKVADVFLPFTTTPMNITTMMLNYSPAGLANVAWQVAKGANATDIIDSSSKAVVGSLVMALGFGLRSLGLITAGDDDDKDKAAWDKARGVGSYSIRTPFGYASYDWAQPVGSLIALGADLVDSFSANKDISDALFHAVYSAGDSVLNMSLFQNILRVLQKKGSPTESFVKELTMGLAGQMLPGIVGDIAKVIDSEVRSTYTGGNLIDDTYARLAANVPGLSKTLPESRNVRGEALSRGGLLERSFNTLVNPANMTTGKNNAVDDELEKLYNKSKNSAILPNSAPYNLTGSNGSFTFTGEERSQFQKTQGETYYKLAGEFIKSKSYQKMSDAEKEAVLEKLSGYSTDTAKREFYKGKKKPYTSDFDAVEEARKDGIAVVDYYIADSAMKAAAKKSGHKDGSSKLQGLIDSDLSNSKIDALAERNLGKDQYSRYKAARDIMGLSPKQAKDFWDNADTDENGSLKQVEVAPALSGLDYATAVEVWATFGWTESKLKKSGYKENGTSTAATKTASSRPSSSPAYTKAPAMRKLLGLG